MKGSFIWLHGAKRHGGTGMRIKPDKNTKKITQNGITTVLNNFSYDYRPYVTAAVFIICFVFYGMLSFR